MNKDILLQGNGKPWLTDENKTVPKKCPTCGADMGLFLMGEPVFLCKGADRHYYGTLKFTAESEDKE
ncbi:MAG: hypothetical protein IKN54_00245 [Lachnospiraceae bacterium]|nr:hypothetical protein [Lachnospiraceae bacterium]